MKNRLRRVATVITRQYRDAKVLQRLSQRSSVSSTGTVSSHGSSLPSHRDSIASVHSLDSLRSLRESFSQKVSVPTSANLSQTGAATGNVSIASSGSSHITHNHAVQTSGGGRANLMQSTSQGISELEQQKAVNENLQKQILENIRRQEELVRRLQARSQVGSEQKGVQAGQVPNNSYQAMQQQRTTGSLNATQQNLPANQHCGSGSQQNSMLNMNLVAQARLNPNLMAQAALMNQNQGLAPLIQNQLQLGNSMSAANLMIGNVNLLRQSLRLPSQHSGLTAQQVQLLGNSGTVAATNTTTQSVMSSLQPQARQQLSGGTGGSSATQHPGSSSESNPSMPPPRTLSQRRPSESDNVQDSSKDASPLSPASFNW